MVGQSTMAEASSAGSKLVLDLVDYQEPRVHPLRRFRRISPPVIVATVTRGLVASIFFLIVVLVLVGLVI